MQAYLEDDGEAWERATGAASRPLPARYRPRSPEGTVLHRVVRENLESFLAEARERSEHGFGLPRFVDDEFRNYLACGVISRGFMRVVCGSCGDEILVGFSCKRRGLCPSCTARRAVDAAAHLVTAVLPVTPMRQWVLTFPVKLRWIFARKPALASRALAIFLRALSTHQRQRARAVGVQGIANSGAVTFVQRFNSALGLNIHFHVVAPDGVFTATDDGKAATFHRLPAPRDEDVSELLHKVRTRVLRMLRREVGDGDDDNMDALAALQAAGLKPNRSPARNDDDPPRKRLTAFIEGFSLHAGVHIHEHDRLGLERLCRYGARGAIALSRLEELPDGRVSYHMKRALPDGRTHLVLTGMELLRKLAPLVPPPRFNLLRFHGFFAPNAKLRPLVVPKPPECKPTCEQTHAVDVPKPATSTTAASITAALMITAASIAAALVPAPSPSSPYRLNWAAALKRVWGIDIFACSRCGGRLTIVAFIEKASAVKAILEHLALPSVPLPIEKARGPPQLALGW